MSQDKGMGKSRSTLGGYGEMLGTWGHVAEGK